MFNPPPPAGRRNPGAPAGRGLIWDSVFGRLPLCVAPTERVDRCSLFFVRAGLRVSVEKSVLCPVSRLTYLGVDVGFRRAAAQVKAGALIPVRDAISRCCEFWPVLWRQRLAGHLNFLRPFLKLPLEAVSAVLDGDIDAFVDSGHSRSGHQVTSSDLTSEKENLFEGSS